VGRERNGWWPPVLTSGHRDKEGEPTWGGDDRWPLAPSCSPRGERYHREQSGMRDWVTVLGSQNRNGPLTGGPGPVKNIISNFQTPLKLAN
jgi:hypothetical protein